mgnify:CR=1 FL=1
MEARYIKPMTLREIAEIEGISHQAVMEIIERALKKMGKELKNRGVELQDLVE